MRLTEEEIVAIISRKIGELTFKKITDISQDLIDSGILSSLTIVELAVELEKNCSVSISFMEINKDNFKNVTAIKNLIFKKLS